MVLNKQKNKSPESRAYLPLTSVQKWALKTFSLANQNKTPFKILHFLQIFNQHLTFTWNKKASPSKWRPETIARLSDKKVTSANIHCWHKNLSLKSDLIISDLITFIIESSRIVKFKFFKLRND
jgi:hypothetical protein